MAKDFTIEVCRFSGISLSLKLLCSLSQNCMTLATGTWDLGSGTGTQVLGHGHCDSVPHLEPRTETLVLVLGAEFVSRTRDLTFVI